MTVKGGSTVVIIEVLFADCHDQLMPLALVVYKFDGVPNHPVLVRPHGNAKLNKAY